MPSLPVLGAQGKPAGTLELKPEVFGVEIRVPLLHQAVTRDLDHAPVSVLHRVTKDRVVTLHGGLHRVGKPLPQPCARLEISEDERNGFGRGVADHGACELQTPL